MHVGLHDGAPGAHGCEDPGLSPPSPEAPPLCSPPCQEYDSGTPQAGEPTNQQEPSMFEPCCIADRLAPPRFTSEANPDAAWVSSAMSGGELPKAPPEEFATSQW